MTPGDPGSDPLLSVRDLRTTFHTDRERVHAVDGVSFDVHAGETVGIVGESGAGKTVTARSIVGLVDSPGRIHPDSTIRFRGDDLGADGDRGFDAVRGSGIAVVFQDSLSALNPMYTVGNQLLEAFRYQRGLTGQEAHKRAVDLLESVGIPDARQRLADYPHQFSGGMRQRALVAMALACDPDLLVCDEPTTALDVTTQAQILRLLTRLQEERDMSMLFITHDMGVIAQVADHVNVMYAGEIVECAPVEELFESPKHPYTRGLLESVPSARRDEDVTAIPGRVPTPTEPATSCRFAPRCPDALDACSRVHPASVDPEPKPAGSEGDADGSPRRTVSCLLHPGGRDSEERIALHERADGTDAGDDHGIGVEESGRSSGELPYDARSEPVPGEEHESSGETEVNPSNPTHD